MIRRTLQTVLLILLGALWTAKGQAAPIDAQRRAEDRRLETPVTLIAPHIYLGELLEKLSVQAGVAVRADNRDEASGAQLAVCLDRVPLGDVLNALWSLVSDQRAEWDWERDGKPGEYTYRLVQPRSARDNAARIRQEIQDAFEDEAAMMLSALGMTPKERRELAKSRPELKDRLNDERTMIQLSIFRDMLSAQERLRVLRGEESPKIPFRQLSGQAQAFAREQTRGEIITSGYADGSATVEESPEPKWVQFKTDLFGAAVYPTMSCFINGGGLSCLGFGNMDDRMRARLAARWMLPGDAKTNPVEAVKIPRSNRPNPLADANLPGIDASQLAGASSRFTQMSAEEQSRVAELQKNRGAISLTLLAEAAPLSFIARLPFARVQPSSGITFGPFSLNVPADFRDMPYNQRVRDFLDKWHKEPPFLMRKWRGNVLLIQPPFWFMDEATQAPYGVVKRLRQAEQAGDGFFPVSELAAAAGALNEPQLQRLNEEFPTVMNIVTWLRPLFLLVPRYPEIVRGGAALNDELIAALRDVPGLPIDSALKEGTAQTLRITERLNPKSLPPNMAGIDVELLDEQEKATRLTGFAYTRRPAR
jgi:hypothetical protein